MAIRIDPFEGTGEVRRLARSMDWAGTSLGPVEGWSTTLLHTVRTALDSPFPVNLWCGPELVLIYNDAYRDILGDKHPDALGRPGTEVWSEIWSDIAPMFRQIREGGPPVFHEDAPFVVSRTGDRPEDRSGPPGPNAWFTFSLSPVRDAEGRIIAFLNIVAERTETIRAERAREAALGRAERAESQLRELFAEAPAFMAVLRGPDHVYEYVNKAYYGLVGPRALLGRSVEEAMPELEGQGFIKLLDRVLETGEPFIGREVGVRIVRAPDRDPETRFVDVVYYPITEADGTRTGVVAHGSDVTDHVLDRREAQQARAEAERANLAKSQFLATMSHEIRTPINAVMGYADLLDAEVAGPLAGDQRGYVDGIAASSRHLLSLVNDILDLAKIEAGEMTVGARELEPRMVVESALRMVSPQVEGRDLHLDLDWKCEDTHVMADEDRVRQILLNLLSNALKFTDDGGCVTVRCRTAATTPADAFLPELGPWFVVDVEDTGRGIPAAQVARIFEPFVQAEAGHTRRAGGTGLGLTISRRLARLMGGELTVRSAAGEGSTFSLWLPPAVQERVSAVSVDDDHPWPPASDQLPGLASAGRALLSVLQDVEDQWVERLRADPRIRGANATSYVQLADHVASLVTAFAWSMLVLEEGGGDPALLRDADANRTAIARRHGRQRRRLGWARAEVEWQYHLLGDVLDAALRREAPKRTAADLGSALAVVQRLVTRAAEASLASFDAEPDLDPDTVEAGRPSVP
jgi:PAS domain S-box-containing protein